MKRILLLILTASPMTAVGGEIFGTLSLDGAPLANTPINVSIAGETYSTQTDEGGRYRLYVPQGGRATMAVGTGEQSASIEIFSSQRSVRYDLILGSENGEMSLRRR